MAFASNHSLPNLAEPTKPFIIVQFPNAMKCTPTNYISWRSQIRSILIGYGLFNFVDGTNPAPTLTITTNGSEVPNPAHATWIRQDQLIYGALVGTLSSLVVPLVSHVDNARLAWKILEDTYFRPSRTHINLLKEKMKSLSKGALPVSNFVQQVKGVADLLASLGKTQDPEDVIDAILKGLDSSFQSVIDGVRARDTTITLEELHEKLLHQEFSLSLAAPPSPSPASAMMAQSKPSKNKFKAPQYSWSAPPQMSQPAWQPPSSSASSFRPPFKGRCQWCREHGHIVPSCPMFCQQAPPNLRPPPPPTYRPKTPPNQQP